MALRSLLLVALVASVCTSTLTASADSASIGVGETGFARPPVRSERGDAPRSLVVDDASSRPLPTDAYRSPLRLTVGPAAITSGQGIGPGLFTALDLGAGVVGVRFAAAWFRGDAPDDPAARLGARVGLYAGELTLDLRNATPLHLILGLGLGAMNLGSGHDAWGVAGLGRVGFEYALGLDEADVRLGASLSGGLLGPLDAVTANAQTFATMTATFSLGF